MSNYYALSALLLEWVFGHHVMHTIQHLNMLECKKNPKTNTFFKLAFFGHFFCAKLT